MIVKVCGIKDQNNLSAIEQCHVDMIGFNFYEKSVRFINNPLSIKNKTIQRVGVFVNVSHKELLLRKNQFDLDYLQLHGDESFEYCKEAAQISPIIKVFRIHENFDFSILQTFKDVASMFLFDSYHTSYGGTGKKFNWNLLDKFDIPLPFLLSGGISIDDVDNIKSISHPKFAGIDINSKFESSPAIKDVDLVHFFLNNLGISNPMNTTK